MALNRVVALRQCLHRTRSVWNRYKTGADKPRGHTENGESGTDQICYPVPNGLLMKVIL